MKHPHVQQSPAIPLSLVLLLSLLTALDAMAIDLYLPGMPAIARDFATGASQVQQTLSIFLIGLALGQGLYGPLLDRYGRRLPTLAGVALFILGSLLVALAPTLEWLMAARFLQALGASAGLVAPRAIVTDLYSTKDSAQIFSLLMQVMMIAPIVAPLAGSYLLEHGGWRFIFWVLGLLGGLGLVWCLKSLPESLPPERRVALHPSSVMRAYARQLGNPVFMAYTLAGGFILGSLFIYISASPFVFTGHFGLSPTTFGYLFAGNALSLVIGGQFANWLLRKGFHERRAMYLGIALHGLAGLFLLGLVLAGQAVLWAYIGLLALALGSLGIVFGNLSALTMANAGRQAGVASALMGMAQYLLAALVGYAIGHLVEGIVLLPLSIAACALLATLLCMLAGRLPPLRE